MTPGPLSAIATLWHGQIGPDAGTSRNYSAFCNRLFLRDLQLGLIVRRKHAIVSSDVRRTRTERRWKVALGSVGSEPDPLHFACGEAPPLTSWPGPGIVRVTETQITSKTPRSGAAHAHIAYCIFNDTPPALLVATARHANHLFLSQIDSCHM
jgi:hypothetical protein